MSALKKWILYSTLIGVFCSRFYVVVGGLTLYYFYFLIIFNLALLLMMGVSWFPQRLRDFFLYLLASGVFGLVTGTNSTAGFLKSFVGVAVCALYSAAFIKYVQFDATEMFRKYAHLAFYISILGFFMLPISAGRLTSVMNEPSAFARTCVPALFYYASLWLRERRHTVRLLVLLTACILTYSSLGLVGMMMGAIFLVGRYRVGRVLVPVIASFLFLIAWNQSALFKVRMTDVLLGVRTSDVRELNESSFGTVMNALITEKQFAAHPILGGGYGSYFVAHATYLDTVPGAFFLRDELRALGEWDASSLFLRIVSELGIVGLVGSFWYLWHYFPRRGTPEERSIGFAILCYVFMKFCRSGEYFGSEVFFMFSIYTVLGAKVRIRSALQNQRRLRFEAMSLADAVPSPQLGMTSATHSS